MVKSVAVTAAVILAFFGLSYFFILGGGKPIGTDLTIIGMGSPTLVLAYENYSPDGGEALNRLRKIKSDYLNRLDFVIADLGTPAGRSFAERYQLLDGQAILLNKEGTPLGLTTISVNEDELRTTLESKLATVE